MTNNQLTETKNEDNVEDIKDIISADSEAPYSTTDISVQTIVVSVGAISSLLIGFLWLRSDPGWEPIAMIVGGIFVFLGAVTETLRITYRRGVLRKNNPRKVMIDVVEFQWIKGVLKKNLLETGELNVLIEVVPDLVAHPRQYPDLDTVNERNDITFAFDEFDGRLLIVGGEGSGKTMLLLRLCEELLNRARASLRSPIPVVLYLTSWIEEQLPFDEWLELELQSQYLVTKSLARNWIENDSLLLLLDEFHSIPSTLRENCLVAINQYISQFRSRIVLCSRTEALADLNVKPDLHAAVKLRELTESEIIRFLESENLFTLKSVISEDNTLSSMARVPFLLNAMSFAYYGVSRNNITLPTDLNSESARIDHILENYIRKKLSLASGYFPARSVRYYLRQLAVVYYLKSKPTIYVESIQPWWLLSRYSLYRVLYSITSLIPFIIFGIIFEKSIMIPHVDGILSFKIIATISVAFAVPYGFFAGFNSLRNSETIRKLAYTVKWYDYLATVVLLTLLQSIFIGFFVIPLGLVGGALTGDIMRGLFYGFIITLVLGSINGILGFIYKGKKLINKDDFDYSTRWEEKSVKFPCLFYTLSILAITVATTLFALMMLPLVSIFVLNIGLILSLFVLIGIQFTRWINDADIMMAEDITFHLYNLRPKNLVVGLRGGLTIGLIVAIAFAWFNNWHGSILYMFFLIVIFAIIFILLFQTITLPRLLFSVDENTEKRVRIGSGIIRSLKNAMILALVGAIVGLIIGCILYIFLGSQRLILLTSVTVGVIYFLTGGGFAILHHYLLRLVLTSERLVPWRFAKFLRYTTEIGLLRAVGGGHIFRHQILQDYFARLATTDYTQLIELNNRKTVYYYRRAELHRYLGNAQEALDDYLAVIQQNNLFYPRAFYHAAEIYYQLGPETYTDALEKYEEYARLLKEIPPYLSTRIRDIKATLR